MTLWRHFPLARRSFSEGGPIRHRVGEGLRGVEDEEGVPDDKRRPGKDFDKS